MMGFLASAQRLLRSRPLAAAAVASIGTSAALGSTYSSRIGGSSLAMLEAAKGVPPSPFVRIVSYNVLSSHLCEPDHFVACKPEDLDPPVRLERIKAALQDQCEREAVICLQEVSTQWVGELTPFFEKNGYTFVSGNYGSPFNGYMGVSLAWPKSRFEAEACDITRCADTRRWPKPVRAPEPSVLRKSWRWLKGLFGGGGKEQKPFDVLFEAKKRHNMVVSARLRCKRSGVAFAVSTYHMPCLFGSDPKECVMVQHAALVAQHAQKFAGGLPCVLAGDFNFQPPSSCYQLVTEGSLPSDHVHAQLLASAGCAEGGWEPVVSPPMTSAYVSAGLGEPEFTNLATTKFSGLEGPPFCETLDYIFLSKGHWNAQYVRPLPKKETVLANCASYPIADEPSDHVAIYADLDLSADAVAKP